MRHLACRWWYAFREKRPSIHAKKKRVHGVFLGGWPTLDLTCQNCIETRATWDKVSEMCVKYYFYIIKCKTYRIKRLAEVSVSYS